MRPICGFKDVYTDYYNQVQPDCNDIKKTKMEKQITVIKGETKRIFSWVSIIVTPVAFGFMVLFKLMVSVHECTHESPSHNSMKGHYLINQT